METLAPTYNPFLFRQAREFFGWRGALWALVCLGMGLSIILPTQLIYSLLSLAISSSPVKEPLQLWAWWGLVLGGLYGLFVWADSALTQPLKAKLESLLLKRVLQQVCEKEITRCDEISGDMVWEPLKGDIEQLSDHLVQDLGLFIRIAAAVALVFVLFVFKVRTAGLVFSLGAFFLAWIPGLLRVRDEKLLLSGKAARSTFLRKLREGLFSIRTVRSIHLESYLQRTLEAALTEEKNEGARRGRRSAVGKAVATFFKVAVFAALWITTVSVAQKNVEFTTDTLAFAGIYFFLSFALWEQLNRRWKSIVEHKHAWDRIQTILTQGKNAAVSLRFDGATDYTNSRRLEIHGLTFRESLHREVGGMDIQLLRGELMVLLAPPRTGKSVFLEGVAGLRSRTGGSAILKDEEGRILWDSSKERNRTPIDAFAFVEQNPYVFEGTVRDNLCFGNQNRVSETWIWHALEKTRLERWARQLGGLDSWLSQEARPLTLDVRYRLSLCRALLLRRPWLIVDEPFSEFAESELEVIVAALNQEKLNAGILIATQDLPDDLNANRILSFDSFFARPLTQVTGVAVGANSRLSC